MQNTNIYTRSAQESFARLTRFFTRLMRAQLSCSELNIHQCYALEVLIDGPLDMKTLSARIGLHQSTMTRLVEKLEQQNLLKRVRQVDNQRVVRVHLKDRGREMHNILKEAGDRTAKMIIEGIPPKKRESVRETLELLADLLDPEKPAFQSLINCCKASPAKKAKK